MLNGGEEKETTTSSLVLPPMEPTYYTVLRIHVELTERERQMAQRLPYAGVPSLSRPETEPVIPIPDGTEDEPEPCTSAPEVVEREEAIVRSPLRKKTRLMEQSATPKASTSRQRRPRVAPVMRDGVPFYLCICGTYVIIVYRFPFESFSPVVCVRLLHSRVSLFYRQGVQKPCREKALYGYSCRKDTHL